jgi:prefoldin subunit 5
MSRQPSVDEYVVYLANRIDEQERLLMKCGDAINNLDARLMMVERLLARVKHELEGRAYEESKLKWWN